MILLLCYLCPPLAVLFMGKPFSAVLNVFLTGLFFWVPGIKHALVCYADYKSNKQVGRLVGAINNPAHAKRGSSGGSVTNNVTHNHYASGGHNDPGVGVNGTVFERV